MSQSTTAIYENGVLRLQDPLDLPEHARVRVIVEPLGPVDVQSDDSASGDEEHRQRLHQALLDAGLVLPFRPEIPPGDLLSEQERRELARRLAHVGPVSDIIFEEREGR